MAAGWKGCLAEVGMGLKAKLVSTVTMVSQYVMQQLSKLKKQNKKSVTFLSPMASKSPSKQIKP